MEDNLLMQIKEFIRSKIYNNDDFRVQWAKSNPFVGTENEYSYQGKTDFTLGIIYDPAHYHRYFMAACQDLRISYKIVDILKDSWIEEIEKSNCEGFMVWPHLNSFVLKEIIDERIFLINKYLKIPVYPNLEAISILDNKRRVRDWLLANKFTPPKTWCFTEKKEALEFIDKTTYPIVFKTVKGSVSHGVSIILNKAKAKKLVHQCFGKGVYPFRMDRRNVQWDFILFQEYLEDCDEKRVIRIGSNYFIIDKVRGNSKYHSGSGYMKWGEQDDYFLNKTKEITDKGGFTCMNVDFLVDKKGNAYVNELHALFHGPKIEDRSNIGMYLLDELSNKWIKREGNHYRNYTTNYRVLDFVNQIGLSYTDNENWLEKDVFYEINGIKM